MNHIVYADLTSGHYAVTDRIYQYDYGMTLVFRGIELPENYEVHFSNGDVSGESKAMLGNADGVAIPDEYLLTGNNVYAWIFLHDTADDGETVYKVTIPVAKRAEPSDSEPTPVQQDIITQAIALLNTAVESASASAESASSSAESASASATSASGSADTASASATNASTSAETATTKASEASASASQAESAKEAVENLGVTAETLEPGSQATVTKTVDEHGVVTLTFGIPKGGAVFS